MHHNCSACIIHVCVLQYRIQYACSSKSPCPWLCQNDTHVCSRPHMYMYRVWAHDWFPSREMPWPQCSDPDNQAWLQFNQLRYLHNNRWSSCTQALTRRISWSGTSSGSCIQPHNTVHQLHKRWQYWWVCVSTLYLLTSLDFKVTTKYALVTSQIRFSESVCNSGTITFLSDTSYLKQ